MADDALVTQLIARVLSLEDIIDGLDARCERNMTLAVSNRQQLEQMGARLRDVSRLRDLVTGEAAEAGVPHHSHAAPRPQRHLTLIRGGLAACAPLGMALRWTVRSRAHKVIAWGIGLSVAAAGIAHAPVMATLPGAPHPHLAAAPYHRHRHRDEAEPVLLAPAGPQWAGVRASRRRDDDDTLMRAQAPATPSPSPDASPTTSPTPSPSPSASPTGTAPVPGP